MNYGYDWSLSLKKVIVDPQRTTTLKQIAIATIVTKNKIGTGSLLPKLKIWGNIFLNKDISKSFKCVIQML